MKKFLLIFYLFSSPFVIAQGYICAVGGGSEDYNKWSDQPYSWIVEKSSFGKIAVLSYSDQTEWIPDYFKSFGALSAENIKIPSRTVADDQSTYDKIVSAQAVFIKGGDQWKYINYWKGTKTEEAIIEVFNNGGVIAGTSAGAMVLGDLDFSAKNGSAYSKESLIDPFNSKIEFEDNFLNLVPNTIFDTHFIERGRFGRLIAFLFNANNTLSKDLLGIGIDDRTAICINPDRTAIVYGSGAVSIFQKDGNTFYAIEGDNYTIENMRCDQLLHGWEYDIDTKSILQIPETVPSFDSSLNSDYPLTNIWLTGTDNMQQNIDNGLQQFFSSVNTESLLLIYNKNYESTLSPITDYLNDNSYYYNLLPVSDSNINYQVYVDRINNATALIIFGNDLSVLSILSDESSIVGNVFYSKVSNQAPIIFFGNSGKISGGYFVDNTDGYRFSGYYGEMTNNTGLNIFGNLVFQPGIFEDDNYYENRTSALLWEMTKNQKQFGLYLDSDDYAVITSGNNIITSNGNLPLMIIDSRASTRADFSSYIAGGTLPRQIVGIDNLRYTISSIDKRYNFELGTGINNAGIPDNFQLNQNYPNPFNSTTNISFTLQKREHIKLEIYDMLGRRIKTILNEVKSPGKYSVKINFIEKSSGVYFYKLSTSNYSITKKMVYIK